MSLLRVTLRLILSVNICLHHASRWTRMIWCRPPGIVQQFHSAQFLEHDATPILRRPDRPQSAFTLAAVLITEHARFTQTIAAQPMRAKQPREFPVDGTDRLLVRHGCPNQPVHVLHGLKPRLDDTHPNFTIPPVALSLCQSSVYNTVVLAAASRSTPAAQGWRVGLLPPGIHEACRLLRTIPTL